MKIAILSESKHGFRRILSEGLQRMLKKLNVDSDIYTNGLARLKKIDFKKQPIKKIASDFAFINFLNELKNYDCIVVVESTPYSFLKNYNQKIELLRSFIKVPIVNLANYYLGTRGEEYIKLREGKTSLIKSSPGNFGLERYDYYLCSSIMTNASLIGENHPFSRIGCDLDDGNLYIEKKDEFIALLDFKRSYTTEYTKLQIQALEETNTKYISLDGYYSFKEIREIYRKCSIFFIAHEESFGVQVPEVQACGMYVFTPQKNWLPGHYLKDSSTVGEGELSENFIVYENDLEKLKSQIIKIKSNYDPNKVQSTLMEKQPYFYKGDIDELKVFIKKLKNKEITHKSHKDYHIFNKYALESYEKLIEYQNNLECKEKNEAKKTV